MKIFLRLIFLLFLFPIQSSYAQDSLTPQQVERVKVCKNLLEEIDTKSLQRTINELEKSLDPEMNLQIMEAMARTYVDIVRENNVVELKNKQWLYSMITLNMANIQFGGGVDEESRDAPLNRLIQRKLKEHLSPELMNHPGFSKSVE